MSIYLDYWPRSWYLPPVAINNVPFISMRVHAKATDIHLHNFSTGVQLKIPALSCENDRSPTRMAPIFLNAPARPRLLPVLIYTKINQLLRSTLSSRWERTEASSLSPLSVTREGTGVYLLKEVWRDKRISD